MREVDDEVRRERVADVWSRYGIRIVVGIVAVLVALGLGLWWHAHREAQRGIEGEQLQAAFDKLGAGDTRGADAALAPIARDGGPGYRTLARMTRGDIALRAKDDKGAARLFASIVADDGVAQPLRDLALVRQTAAEYDTLPPAAVASRLRGLAVRGNPYFGSAGEMVALAYLHLNKRDLAQSLFAQIAGDDTVPATLRQRAVQMASALAAGAPQQAGLAAAPQRQDKPAT
ncbi:MAG: hypothetical protein ACRYFW_16700 [Janthinobacterium lividum]